MKIHHYTSIETLALILSNKTIRFNRLDRVDDLEESEYGISEANIKMSQYNFVSCWTKDDIENIALWGLYTQYKGIRISLNQNMFITYPIFGNSDIRSYFQDFVFGEDHFFAGLNNEVNLVDIEYTENLKEKIASLGKYTVNEEQTGFSLDLSNKHSIYKRKQWEFQKESRFIISALPSLKDNFNEIDNNEPNRFLLERMKNVGTLLYQGHPISIKHVDIQLNDDAFNDIEIMLAPQTSLTDRIIVESLVHRFCPTAIIKNSSLKDKIRQKGTF